MGGMAPDIIRMANLELQNQNSGSENALEPPHVIFYRLTRKFVDSEESIPQASEDIVFYALAVGHHTGVIDCFEEELTCSAEQYQQIIRLLPYGEARYKMDGILRGDEIQVDRSHYALLCPVVEALIDKLEADDTDLAWEKPSKYEIESPLAWLKRFSNLLDVTQKDSAVYYMGRLRY